MAISANKKILIKSFISNYLVYLVMIQVSEVAEKHARGEELR